MQYDALIEALFDVDLSRESDANVALDCPECGRPRKFSMHREKGVGHCWVCDHRTNATRLLQDVRGLTLEEAIIELVRVAKAPQRAAELAESDDPNAHILLAVMSAFRKQPLEEVTRVKLPEGLKPVGNSPRARRYLRSRGFTPEYYEAYNLKYQDATLDVPWAGHIVFPNYNAQRKVDFWTTRATWNPENGRKSYNPKGVKRGGILYGSFALAKPRGTLYVVEGPLDAIALSQSAVALLGKTISNEQCAGIARLHPKCVYVCLDADALVSSVMAAKRLAARLEHEEIFYAALPYKDPAEGVQRGLDVRLDIQKASIRYTPTSLLRERLSR